MKHFVFMSAHDLLLITLPCAFTNNCEKVISVLLYALFWVIPRRLNFMWLHFGTLYLFYLHKRVGMKNDSAYEDGTECSETSAYKFQTPGNYPEESIQYSEHGESLKSRIINSIFYEITNRCSYMPSILFHC